MFQRNLMIMVCLVALTSVLAGASYSSDTGEFLPGLVLAGENPDADLPSDENAQKDVNSWSGSGPWGGNVRCLTVDPVNNSRVFAACGSSLTAVEGGVYYSIDGGEFWQPTTLPRKAYNAVAASLAQPGVFYAGARNGLYKSEDYGLTWNAAGQSSTYILGLGVNPANGSTIVMGKSGNTGIVVSTDGGNNFAQVGVNSGFMRQFTWSNAEPGKMYVVMGSSTASVLSSVDNGQTWTPFGPAGDGWGMYISPTSSQFALIAHASGIYRTADGGANWANVQGGVFRSVTGFNDAYFATANDGGIFRSNDQGLTWQPQTTPVPQSTWQTATSTNLGALFGHWGGIFRVSGYDQAAAASHTGLNLALVHGLAYYADTTEIWGGTEGSGLYRSVDGGTTWEHMVNGLGNWMVYELQPTNHQFYQSGRMLAGTLNGAYTSLDGGQTWSYAHFQGTQVSACEVHPTNPDIYWLGSATGEIKFTTDGGLTFQTSTGGMFGFAPRLKLGRAPMGGLRLFLCYQGSATAIWYSDDGGVSFIPASGMESTTYQPMVAVRPHLGVQPQIIYASSNSGVYKSTDNGATYTLAGMPGFSWSVLAGPGAQVVSGKDNGVSYSTDEAANSTSITQNLEASANIWQMAWGSSTNQVYIAMRTRGIMENRFSADIFNPPTGLTAVYDDQAIILFWEPVNGTPSPVSYTIWRDAYPIASVPSNQTTYTDSGLNNGQAYRYFISAVYNNDIHTSAIEIITAVPNVPSHVPVSQFTATASGTTVNLNWSGPPSIQTGYKLYRDGALIAEINDPNADSYSDADLAAGTYLYSITVTYLTGDSDPVEASATVYVENDDPGTPALTTQLQGSYPNPGPSSWVKFSLKEPTRVCIRCYNLRGALVRKLVDQVQPSGEHLAFWDGRDEHGALVPSGIYLIRMTAGAFVSPVQKIIIRH